MTKNEKLKKITSERTSNWLEDAAKKLANRGSRKNARKVALRVLQLLRERGISQTELAGRMGVSRQQVTKIVKGQENFSFETIDKLEKALDCTIMTINEKAIVADVEVSQITSVITLPPFDWTSASGLRSYPSPVCGSDILSISRRIAMHVQWSQLPIIFDATDNRFAHIRFIDLPASPWGESAPVVFWASPVEPGLSEEYKIISQEEIDYSMS